LAEAVVISSGVGGDADTSQKKGKHGYTGGREQLKVLIGYTINDHL